MTQNDNNETLLTFPCEFSIKVFGLNNPEFEAGVLMLIKQHVPDFNDQVIQHRTSENGKYLAMNITIQAESKAQLDSIYRDLSASPLVVMAL